MKTKALKTENKENTKFAFLPEMILDHLNEAKPTETIIENSNEVIIEKITITAEPDIPNLDSVFVNNKKHKIETSTKIKIKKK